MHGNLIVKRRQIAKLVMEDMCRLPNAELSGERSLASEKMLTIGGSRQALGHDDSHW